MKASTKLLVVAASSAAAYGVVRAVRHVRAKQFERNLDAVLTDLDDGLDEPVIVAEEIITYTEISPDDFRATK